MAFVLIVPQHFGLNVYRSAELTDIFGSADAPMDKRTNEGLRENKCCQIRTCLCGVVIDQGR